MAIYRGDDGTISLAKSGGATLNAQIKDFTLNTEAGIIEASSKGDAWKGNKAGRKGWTVEVNAHYGANHPVEGDTVALTMDVGDGTTFTGNAIVNSVDYGSPEGDSTATLALSCTGDGALTRTPA